MSTVVQYNAIGIAERALGRSEAPMTLRELMAHLRRAGIRADPEELSRLLASDRSPKTVRTSLEPVRFALAGRGETQASPAETHAPPDVWAECRADIVRELHDVALDVLALRVTAGPGGPLRLRFDVVEDDRAPYWLTLAVPERALLAELCGRQAWTLGAGVSLPLRRLRPELVGDAALLGVWRSDSPRAGGDVAITVLKDVAQAVPANVRHDATHCAPVEADRRREIDRYMRRVSGPRRGPGFAQATCIKCGLPLSHPDSVRRGIGPECSRYYSRDFTRELSSAIRSGGSQRVGAKRQRQWLDAVLADFQR